MLATISPTTFTGKLKKPRKRGRGFGIQFEGKGTGESPVIISHVPRWSFWKRTNLVAGLRVESINGHCVIGHPSEFVTKLLEQTPPGGDVQIVASGIVTKYDKRRRDDKLGLKLLRNNHVQKIFVVGMDPRSPFACSGLRAGQVITRVNGKPCPEGTEDVIKKLKQPKHISIVAIDLPTVEKSFRTTKAQKILQEKEEKIHFVQSHLQDHHLPNHLENVTVTLDSVTLDEPKVTVTLDAPPRRKLPQGYLEHSVYKPTMDTRVGLVLQKDPQDGTIKVKHVDPDGLFASTGLRPGQRIISINGEKCPAFADDAVHVIRYAEGTLTLQVETLLSKLIETTVKTPFKPVDQFMVSDAPQKHHHFDKFMIKKKSLPTLFEEGGPLVMKSTKKIIKPVSVKLNQTEVLETMFVDTPEKGPKWTGTVRTITMAGSVDTMYVRQHAGAPLHHHHPRG